MGLKDYLQGPKYKDQVSTLEGELRLVTGRLAELQERYEKLKALAMKYGAMDMAEVQQLIAAERVHLEQVRANLDLRQREVQNAKDELGALQAQVLVMEESLLLESFALYLPKFALTSSAAYKERLEQIRATQKTMIKEGFAATGGHGWTVNNSATEGKRLVNDMIKLVIRSFNNEADYCVDNVKFDNIELGEKRIRKSFETLNKLGRIMSVTISETYLNLKLDELRLAHEFQIKKQEEKEEAKRAREELREQQKLEQELRAAREKIAKERRHFNAALKDLEARLATAASAEDKAALQAKIVEVQAGREALDGEEKLIDYREKNAKAGYVYVISNIGAFGEGVFKIGMTRRLEPMDRVDELGDASVPFDFDVHALVFSEDAPALEAKLHERFTNTRLNKVNGRKEFFRADIQTIEEIIRANFDSVAEVVHEAPAEQYRESLRLP